MIPKYFIKHKNEKFYDAKEYYERIKNKTRIHYGGISDFCVHSLISTRNGPKTKIFYVETVLPKFFRPVSILYYTIDGKLHRRVPHQTGPVDAIICFSHGLVAFIFIHGEEIYFNDLSLIEANENNLCDRIIKDEFYREFGNGKIRD